MSVVVDILFKVGSWDEISHALALCLQHGLHSGLDL